MKKNVFHLAWSPDTLPTEEAICPLTNFLSEHLTKFNTSLLNGNFLRSLHILWDFVMFQLKEHTDSSNGVGAKVALGRVLEYKLLFSKRSVLGMRANVIKPN